MSDEITEFEKAVQDALTTKRLSGTHVQNVTESGTRLLKYDRQIIDYLLATLRSLPPKSAQRISLLYCTDALCRAVRSLWRRAAAATTTAGQHTPDGSAGAGAPAGQQVYDPRTKAVAQSFLENMETVVETFVAQLLAPGYIPPNTASDSTNPSVTAGPGGVEVWVEGKEKMRKIIEIWRKNETFASAVMDRLETLLKDLDRIQATRLVPGLAGLIGVGAGVGAGAQEGKGGPGLSGPLAGTSNGVANLLSLLAAHSIPSTGVAGTIDASGKGTPTTGYPVMGITPTTTTMPVPASMSSFTPPATNHAAAGAPPPDYTKLLSTLTSHAVVGAGGPGGSPSIMSPAAHTSFTAMAAGAYGQSIPPPNVNDALAKRDEIARRLAPGGVMTPPAPAFASGNLGSPSRTAPGYPSYNDSSAPPPGQSPSTSTSGRQLPVHPDRAAFARAEPSQNRGWSNDNDDYNRAGPGPSYSRGSGYGGYRGSSDGPRGGYRGASDGPRGGGRGGRGGGRGGYSRDYGYDSSRPSGYPPAREQHGYAPPAAGAPIQSFEDAESNSRRYGIPQASGDRESNPQMHGRAPLPPPQAGKDEFGRDTTAEAAAADQGGYKRPRSSVGAAGREEGKRPRTEDTMPHENVQATTVPSSAANASGATLETYDWKLFAPSDGTSWATLGEAWKRSNNGREPTQQELMLAFMNHQMAAPGANGAGDPQQQQMMSMMMSQMMGGSSDSGNTGGSGYAPPQRSYRSHDDTHQQARVSWDEEDGPYANFGRAARGRGGGGFRGGRGGRGGGRGGFGGGDNEYGNEYGNCGSADKLEIQLYVLGD
ncbi:hypothetical protein QFC21_004014 [Naganishia friedmannii]|uniref:Uncharacterized protein n=1 Tax=Naganishia friedmannii TaxID=89922 RepID=A0ACC2VJQ7_9TREE|nr:hypothetical protein QFC21_004014 [Naganishia friedmannii]